MSGLRSLNCRTRAGVGVPVHRVALSLACLLLAAPVAYGQDINGDGKVDAVFTQKQRYNQVCFGNGTGAFTTCTDLVGDQFQISNQVNTTASALVDWDGDGDLDIALAMEGRANVVCLNDGGGQFNAGIGCLDLFGYSSFPYNSQDVAAGDLDGDGAPDLVYANGGNAGLPLNQPNVVCVGFNTGASACHEFGTPAPSTGVALGDVDNDGDLDVLISNRGTLNEVCLNGGRDTNGMLFDCRAIPQAASVLATKASNAVAVGHLPPGFAQTPDAYLDVVFANVGKNEVCFGNGNWTGTNVGFACSGFNPVSSYTMTDASATTVDVLIADFMPSPPTAYTGAEIVFVNGDVPNVRCFGTFTCGFAFQPQQTVTVDIGGTLYQVSEPISEVTTGVAVRDINIDGKLDVVVANVGTSRSYMRADCCQSTNDVVANATLHPSSITLSGGTVGPSADTEPPAFFGATNVTVEATGPAGAVASFTVTAVDVNDGARPSTCTPASGSTFPIGNNTVTCTSQDAAGNVGTASFLVTVRDSTGPVVTVPGNLAILAPAGQLTAAVTFSPTAVDAVDGVRSVSCYNIANSYGVLSGDQFASGTTNLTCFASDTRLNHGEASFSITVTTDIDGDGILDDVDTDDDGDGIADSVDTLNTAASSAYATTDPNTGSVTRNGWTVSIAPAPSGSAYSLRASLSGAGTAPAVITAYCSGVWKELRLDTAGESVDWRCDQRSLTANFRSGTPEFWKLSCGPEYQGPGLCGWIRITPTGTGTAVTAGSPVTADASNTAPIVVTIFNEALEEVGSFSLGPEESVDVNVVLGADNEPVLQLEVLNGGVDGTVVVTLFGQTVPLVAGGGPATFDLNPDLTPPAVAAQVSGTLGSNGYYTSDVTVSWTATDGESAVTATGCETQTVTQDTTGVTFTCSATSEGGTATDSVTIMRDTTAPGISSTRSPAANAAGWNNTAVTVTFTCDDAVSGVASCTGSTTLSGEGAGQLAGAVATDLAGNTVTAAVGGINIDFTAPAITVPATINEPATSDSGAVVTYAATVADLLDPTPSFSCAPASGSTFPVGSTTVTCTASDAAGNSSTRSFVVTVGGTTTPGHMHGAGFVRSGGKRYGFELDVREGVRGERGRFRLDVRDESSHGRRRGREDSFVARSVAAVAFSDDPTFRPGRGKRVHVDSVLFSGTGTWNGAGGYTYEVFAEDRGEPGRHRESIRITIRDGSGAVVASVDGELSGGNIQSVRIRH